NITITSFSSSKTESVETTSNPTTSGSGSCSAPTTTSYLGNNSSAISRNGIELSASINATSIVVGQSLNVSGSIYNTLPVANSINTCNDWQFQGIPFSFWPECYYTVQGQISPPMEIAVLNGSYTAEELPSAANTTFRYFGCMEDVQVDQVIFYPDSDAVKLTGLYSVTQSNETLGSFSLQFDFVTGGYWNLKELANSSNPPIGPPASPIAFTPGKYTIAVEDEWKSAHSVAVRCHKFESSGPLVIRPELS
ncbi:MAG: hypothetical protein ACREBQ_12125, partial [Nitrososphaerales archaeon]